MDLIKELKKELQEEAATTRKFFKQLPEDKYDWAPHEKSMPLKSLATHIAEIPEWIAMAVDTNELDLADGYHPTPINSNEDLLNLLEKSVKAGLASLDQIDDEQFDERWALRHGEQVLWDGTKYRMVRLAFSQTSHHRAQLGVYLRLLNIPIPGSYGPSADDNHF
ncbi:DinB family protein [Olivibacter sp. SDN3]|uniref:DinB family protein n=1 Tax=Olivibacter sp. SDN3 TaxID=2764720 RepID=UPI0016516F71|nr:DinB family protein [Olivibacter sp. SDN3]QNL50392.1 DinB family protein [Olivibacter sp. SDN3]